MAKQLTFTISSYMVGINQQAFNSCYPTINLTGISGHTPVEAVLEFRPKILMKAKLGWLVREEEFTR